MHLQLLQKPVYELIASRPAVWQLRLVSVKPMNTFKRIMNDCRFLLGIVRHLAGVNV